MSSEKEIYNLTVSINKALCPTEAPLKIKHARSIIISTHRLKDGKSFWNLAIKQPLMEYVFTAWKFCHLLHKVLREGHDSVLKYSQIHKPMIVELGKLWGHLQDGVGKCIESYTKLLVNKLDFHIKNPVFPGSLNVEYAEIERFAAKDINIYFQLCIELFDYLDCIIDVQSNIFTSINMYRLSSMTPQGQCRLAPLLTLIQDSNPLYDVCVRIMFKLHSDLSYDVLIGHRSRFNSLFLKLKCFYESVRRLQYFANLMQVPVLPEAAPNFTSQFDLGCYIPPILCVQPDPTTHIENLVDATDIKDSVDVDDILTLKNCIQEKEVLINDLNIELTHVKENKHLREEYLNKELCNLKATNESLSRELDAVKDMCVDLKLEKDNLELKLKEPPTLTSSAREEEEKPTLIENNFSKLKMVYTQLREEHINLLRQHSESTKSLNNEKKRNLKLKHEIDDLRKKQIDFIEKEEHVKIVDSLNLKFDMQVKELIKKNEFLQDTYNNLKCQYQTELKGKSLEIEKLKTDMSVSEIYKDKINELENTLKDLNFIIHEKTVEQTEMERKYKDDMKNKETKIIDLTKGYEDELKRKDDEYGLIQKKEQILNEKINERDCELKSLTEKNIQLEYEIQLLKKEVSDFKDKLKAAIDETVLLKIAKSDIEATHDKLYSSLLNCIFQILEKMLDFGYNGTFQQSGKKAVENIEIIQNQLQSMCADRLILQEDQNTNEDICKCIELAYRTVTLHEQLIHIYSTNTDLKNAQDVLSKTNMLGDYLIKFFRTLLTGTTNCNVERGVTEVNLLLSDLKHLIASVDNKCEKVDFAEMIEQELKSMDAIIEETAEKIMQMLSSSKSKDNGERLEVNEKILDSCNKLMECIKILIQKSRSLQEEIVTQGRGTSSVKEFYNKNGHWTEGLISASKNIAKGANFLLEAAQKAVQTESFENFEIIVAAQEIAACTAQLVIASKVKAKIESQRLAELLIASRDVSQATGTVVATVKNLNNFLEKSQELEMSKLTISQVKAMEMEIQIKVLELEQALESERFRLSTFRKTHYQNKEN